MKVMLLLVCRFVSVAGASAPSPDTAQHFIRINAAPQHKDGMAPRVHSSREQQPSSKIIEIDAQGVVLDRSHASLLPLTSKTLHSLNASEATNPKRYNKRVLATVPLAPVAFADSKVKMAASFEHVLGASAAPETPQVNQQPFSHKLVQREETNSEAPTRRGSIWDMMEATDLGEGLGPVAYDPSPLESRSQNRDMSLRLLTQDLATFALLLMAFGATLLVTCLSVYQVSEDKSPVKFYSDARSGRHRLICGTNEPQEFLRTFSTPPQRIFLLIIGRTPSVTSEVRRNSLTELVVEGFRRPHHRASLLRRRGIVLFDVALDVSQFVVSDGRLLSDSDAEQLQDYLRDDYSNPLVLLQLRKKVQWVDWEDVATNIRQRLHALGYTGDIDVRFEGMEDVIIFRNHKWQNFTRSPVTQALVLFSVVGFLLWVPYIWLRKRTLRLDLQFQVAINLHQYWQLIADGLDPIDGFSFSNVPR